MSNSTQSIAAPSFVDPADLPTRTRLTRLAIGLAVLLTVIYVLAPLPIKHFGPMKLYSDVVDRTGISPGALYYSDVEQTLEAEHNNRNAIRYMVHRNDSPATH